MKILKDNIQEFFKKFFGCSCYAYCLTKYFTEDEDLADMTILMLQGWRKGYIDDDCFVSKPVEYIQTLVPNAPIDVTKIYISDLNELPAGEWIVEYKLNPKAKESHFVIANNKKVLFDPAGDSNTVKNGKPFSIRGFIYKGKQGKGNIQNGY